MPALVTAIIALVTVVSGALALFTERGREGLAIFITNVMRGFFKVAGPLLDELAPALETMAGAFSDAFTKYGGSIRKDLEAPLSDFAQSAFTAVTGALEGKSNIKPEDWKAIAGDAFADAVKFGLGSFAVSAAFESVFPERLNTLNSLGPMLATMAGFEEVTAAWLRPILYSGIAQPARYDAQNKFRSMLPDLMTARLMYSRRKITADQFDVLRGYAGLSDDWTAAIIAASYRPVQPRLLLNAYQDTAIPTDQIMELLRDNAYSEADSHLVLDAMQYASLRNVRNSFVSELITAYGAGVLADDELQSSLESTGWSPDAIQLVKQRALIARRVVLAKEVEAAVTAEVKQGYMDGPTGEQQLEAAGVQPWLAQLKITLAETQATLHAARVAATEGARETVREQRNLTKAAIAEYQRGVLDEVTLTAALVAIGLNPSLVASIVAVQEAARTGKSRFVYGKLLSADDAKLLTEQVQAIADQLKKQLITVDHARNALQSYGIEQSHIDALLARWAAMIGKATTTGTLLTP